MRSTLPGRLLGPSALALALLGPGVAPASADDPLKGTLQGVHADYFDAGASATSWQLDTGARTLPVLPTRLPALAPGDTTVAVTDQADGGRVVGPVTAASPQPSAALGGRRLAVIAFNFGSDPSQPWTTEHIRQSVFTGARSTSEFFREESYGRLWLTGQGGNLDGDVYGWYTLDTPTAGCPFATWAAAARSAAAGNGFNPAAYQHVMYVFPPQAACGWAGLAYLPGKDSWINGELDPRVTAHEVGHNLGLHHAGSWQCTGGGGQAVTISSSCALTEYNDPFDVMGAWGSRHNHGWHLQQLGLLEESNVRTVTQSGTYSMTSALHPTTDTTTLRIPRTRDAGGGVQDWYYLEIRESGGAFDDFSPSDWAVGGVSIRVNDAPTEATRSRLLDAHAGGSILDAPLRPGETFADGQLSITTLSASGGNASVQVDLAARAADAQAPTPPSGLSHELAGGGVRLSWLGSTDDVGVAGYEVHRDGVQIGTSAGASYEDIAVPTGAHVYTVYAVDAAGNRSSASAPHLVTVAGPERGAAPAPAAVPGPERGAGSVPAAVRWNADRSGPTVRLRRRRAGRGHMRLSARARDTAGIARLVLRIDGRRVRSRRARRLSYRWRARRGRHRIVVNAVDAVGNRASLERRLRVRR